MMPPPSTPGTKFLFRRPTSTQEQPSQTPFSSTPRFITPRVGVAGSQAWGLRGHGSARQGRVEDEIESSPPSSSPGPPLPSAFSRRRGRVDVRKSIEVENGEDNEDDEVAGRSCGGFEEDVVEDSQEIRSPVRKRRRISISPEITARGGIGNESQEVVPRSSPNNRDSPEKDMDGATTCSSEEENNLEVDKADKFGAQDIDMHEDNYEEIPPLPSPPPIEQPNTRSAPSSPLSSSSLDLSQKPTSMPSALRFNLRPGLANKDTPDRAPPFQLQQQRFILPTREAEVEAQVALGCFPQAFSPQRRGAKYIAGGLAAEVQGWLSHMKGEKDTPVRLRVRVGEIRNGGRMYIVRGRRVGREESMDGTGEMEGEDGEKDDGKEIKVVLAGGGRLTGLGGTRTPLRVGSVVEVGEPTWGVELEGVKWIVGCDWKVE